MGISCAGGGQTPQDRPAFLSGSSRTLFPVAAKFAMQREAHTQNSGTVQLRLDPVGVDAEAAPIRHITSPACHVSNNPSLDVSIEFPIFCWCAGLFLA